MMMNDMSGAGGVFAGAFAIFGIMSLLGSVLGIIMLISTMKIFKKAGKNMWYSLIPIYNIIIMMDIIKMKYKELLFLLIPFVGSLIFLYRYSVGLSKAFGKSNNYALGLFFLSFIFIPLLAFSDNKYVYGDNNVTENVNNNDITNQIENTTINNNELLTDNAVQTVEEAAPVASAPVMEPSAPVVEEVAPVASAPVMEPAAPVVEEVAPVASSPVMEPTAPVVEEIAPVASEPVMEPSASAVEEVAPVASAPVMEPTAPVVEEIAPVASAPVMEPSAPVVEEIAPVASAPVMEQTSINNNDELLIEPLMPENNKTIEVVEKSLDTKNICKKCGVEMPNIVTICPNCGNDNE